MKLSELQELDFQNIGSWPSEARIGAAILLFIVLLGAGSWFFTQDKLDTLQRLEQQEQSLKTAFQAKAAQAANLDTYRLQMKEIESSFGELLMQLPNKSEVADLLSDISQIGLTTGLIFEFFKPEAEIPVDFYAEQPITLRIIGSYHQFGRFISRMSELPRIVTLHDFKLSQRKEGGGLLMEATAKTFRYMDEEEILAYRQKKKTAGKK